MLVLASAMGGGGLPSGPPRRIGRRGEPALRTTPPPSTRCAAPRELYEQAAQIDAKDATIQVKLATACLALGALLKDGALASFQRGEQAARRAVALDGKNADGHFLIAANRGRAVKLLPPWKVSPAIVGRLEKDVLRALVLNPRHARALHMEGMLLYETPAPLRVFLEGRRATWSATLPRRSRWIRTS